MISIKITQYIESHPGSLQKLEQILQSGLLETKGGVAEIHFDIDGNIRKILSPKIIVYPVKD